MVPIVQNLVAASMYNYKVISESKGRTWLYITVHNTANDASAANEISYMRGNYNYTSFHYAVDDQQIVQGLPDNVGAFDTSNRTFSTYGLSIEICYSLSGGSRFTQAEKNAAEFIASKLKEMGYPCDSSHVRTHQQATGKYCPHRTLDLGWTRFMNLIQSYMTTTTDITTKEEVDMTEAEVRALVATESAAIGKAAVEDYIKEQEAKAASDWANAFWNAGVSAGVFDGTMPRGYLTREQAATTYSKMGILELSKDKEASDWAKEVWDKAVDQGVVDGSSPRGPLTREQFVVVLNKLGLLDIQEAVLTEEVESVDQSASWNSYEPQGE